jgi:PAS domain-containing protein
MAERRKSQRSRSLRAGKILFNGKRSVITCTLRNQSGEGASLQVQSTVGIPAFFELLLDGEAAARPCNVVWKAQNRIGIEFADAEADAAQAVSEPAAATAVSASEPARVLRADLLALRAALDEVPVGIVLLDANLRSQFINHAFRAMWRLPDVKADSRPAFVTLMCHGRDTRAYDVLDDELDAYVERRVAHVRAGDASPIDLRLTSGDIIRFRCTTLPGGGRILTYADVTDIIRRSDELERLRGALQTVGQGVIVLDANLDVEFMNEAVQGLWQLPDATGKRPRVNFTELVANARKSKAFDMADDVLEIYLAQRIERVRAGDARPMDLRHRDGRIIRCQCSALPNGGRVLSYTDVTDLVRRADEVRRLSAG